MACRTLPFLVLLLILSTLCLKPVWAKSGQGVLLGDHGQRKILPKSCRACHRGMIMALDGEEGICLDCHGNDADRQKMIEGRYLVAEEKIVLADLGAELRKPYRHPVLSVRGAHRSYEVLPEEMVNASRHSECIDCHNPHLSSKDKPFRGIRGKRIGSIVAEMEKEYELCYNCHSSSANLPLGSTNKADEFRMTNPSFHPVEGEGKSVYVISLKSPYAARAEKPGDISVISCRDCHGNDDVAGPSGPHGSIYKGLLVSNYEMEDGTSESESAYALCYKCHSRSSILNNESFPFHSLHIQGSPASGQAGTSCFSCHDAHGSTRNPSLIRFNEDVVQPNADNKLEFTAQGVAARHGACLLNCHGVEHNPKEY